MYVQWMQHAPFKEVNQIWGVFRETGNRTPREWSKLDPEQQQQVKERMEMALKKSAPVLEIWLAEGLDDQRARALFLNQIRHITATMAFGIQLDQSVWPGSLISKLKEKIPDLIPVTEVEFE